jgi:hypothetical protein
MSEAVFRLHGNFKKEGKVPFSDSSWPKPAKGDRAMTAFTMGQSDLHLRMESLLKALWKSQFVFLESIGRSICKNLCSNLD